MDFELIVQHNNSEARTSGSSGAKIHYTPDTLLDEIKQIVAQWNVLYPEDTLTLVLRKVPNDTPTLGIDVNDELDISELIGG